MTNITDLVSPEAIRHPMSSGLFNKDTEYIKTIEDELDKMFEEEFFHHHHTPKYVFNLKEQFPQPCKESLLFKSHLLGASKLEQQFGGDDSRERRVKSAVSLRQQRPISSYQQFQRVKTPKQFLQRQISDNPADSEKYGKPTRSSILRNQKRVQSAPTVRKTDINYKTSVENKQADGSKLKPRCVSAQLVKKEIHDRETAQINGESIHAFLVGARYNSANFLDTKSIDCYGIYMPKNNPGDCFGRADKLMSAGYELRGTHPGQVSFENSPRVITSEDNERLAAILDITTPVTSPDIHNESFATDTADENAPPVTPTTVRINHEKYNATKINTHHHQTPMFMIQPEQYANTNSKQTLRNNSRPSTSKSAPLPIQRKHSTFNPLPMVRGISMSSSDQTFTATTPQGSTRSVGSAKGGVRRLIPVMKGTYPVRFIDKNLSNSLSITGFEENWLGKKSRNISSAPPMRKRQPQLELRSQNVSTTKYTSPIFQDADDEISNILKELHPESNDALVNRPSSSSTNSRPKTGKSSTRCSSSVPANTPRLERMAEIDDELELEEHVTSITNMTPFEDEVIPEEEEAVVMERTAEANSPRQASTDNSNNGTVKLTVDINSRLSKDTFEDATSSVE